MFRKRIIRPELLDHLPAEEARPNLADLVQINRRFGGHSTLRRILQKVAPPNEPFTLLDVGAASGDTATTVKADYPQAAVTSLDYNAVNLETAPAPKLIGDAFELPFEGESFDYVMCSLFLHHFTDKEVISLLSGFYTRARRALLVCDLERRILPYLFLSASRLICKWNAVTVHDGMISVRAAFREKELLTLAREAGLRNVESQVYRPAFRMAMIARKE